MPKTKRRELSPPEQRRILREREKYEADTRRLAVLKAESTKQDIALMKWANLVKD